MPVLLNTVEIGDPFPVNSECAVYPADIVIVIDGSGSISEEDFNTQLVFVARIIEEHDVTSDDARARIAVVAFSDEVYDHIYLGEYNDSATMIERTLTIP